MSWLDRFFKSGVGNILDSGGTRLPTSDTLQFTGDGVVVTHDPTTGVNTATITAGTPFGALRTALRAKIGAQSGQIEFLEGVTTAGDGGGGYFRWSTGTATDDDGTILNENGFGNPATGYWERIFSGAIDVRWFGADATGASDSTTSLQNMITGRAAAGHALEFLVPHGTFKISSPLTIPNGVKKLVLRTVTDGSLAGDNPAPSVFYCKNVSGYFIDPTAAYGAPGSLTSLALQGIELDGADGSTSSANYSTSFLGAVKPPSSGNYIPNVTYRGTAVRHTKATNAKAYDLQNAFFVELDRAMAWDISNGWGTYILGLGVVSTTLTLRKCYFHGCAEAVHVQSNVTDVHVHDTVIESSQVAIAAYDTNLHVTGLYCENIGVTPAGGTGTVLTQVDLGLNDVLDGGSNPIMVDTAINLRHGSSHFTGCQFNGLHASGNAAAWFRGVGKGQTFGAAGTGWFRSCRMATLTDRFIADDTPVTASRSSYAIDIVDATAFTARGAVAPPGLIILYADARLVTRGRIMIPFVPASNDWRPVIVENGLFVGGIDFDFTRYSAAPADSPDLGQWLAGDKVLAASGLAVYTCVASGTPGTWTGEQVVDSSSLVSKLFYDNLIVVGQTIFGFNANPLSGVQNAFKSDLALDPSFPSSRMAAWLVGGAAGASLFANYGADGKFARNGYAGRWFHDVATGDWVLYSTASGSAGGTVTLVEKLRVKQDGSVLVNALCSVKAGSAATPNSAVVGSPGDIYLTTNGGSATTLWVKESGVGTNTGWVGK